MSLLKDINQNASSKRVAGFAAIATGMLGFLLDGFHFFQLNEAVGQALIFGGFACLGATVFEKKQ